MESPTSQRMKKSKYSPEFWSTLKRNYSLEMPKATLDSNPIGTMLLVFKN